MRGSVKSEIHIKIFSVSSFDYVILHVNEEVKHFFSAVLYYLQVSQYNCIFDFEKKLNKEVRVQKDQM